jgi:hypothetical protein
MRSLSLVLLLLFALSLAQAVPLQGGNGAVKCTLFGLVKTPVSQNINNTQAALELDVGLLGASNATYELVDSKDNVYRPSLYRNLQPGRTLLVFAVPEGALFKSLLVTPTEGNPFSINWWKTPKGTNGNIIMRYYGVVDWAVRPDQQAIAYNVSITNNGSTSIYLSPDNFTLLDQWGWPYYTMQGFTATPIAPKKAARVNLVFGGISPFSIPSALAYDYETDDQIIIDFDKDMGQLTDAQINGAMTPSTPLAPSTSESQTMKPVQQAQTTMQPLTSTQPTPSIPSMPYAKSMEESLQQSMKQSMQQSMQHSMQSTKPVNLVNPVVSAAKTQGAAVTSTQTSAPSGNNNAKSTSNKTTDVMSLKDKINASKARLSGVKSGMSGGESTVGQKINASVAETLKRLEKVKQGLQNTTKNQTQNSTATNAA